MIDTAYIISTCSDGTSALTSIELEVIVDYDTGKTTIQSVIATTKKTWFESDSSNISLLSVWDDLVRICIYLFHLSPPVPYINTLANQFENNNKTLQKNGGKIIKTVLCKNARIQIGSIIIDNDDDIVDHWSEYHLEYSVMGLTGNI